MNYRCNNKCEPTEIDNTFSTGAWEFELASNTLKWSKAVDNILRLERGVELRLYKLMSFVPREFRLIIKNAFKSACIMGTPYRLEMPIELPLNGAEGKQRKYIVTTGLARKNTRGVITHLDGTIEDVSAFKNNYFYEQERNNYLSSILDNLNDTVVTINQDGKILSANAQIEATLGYFKEELLGQNVSKLMPENHALMHDKYMLNYQKTGQAKIIGSGRELTAKKKNGGIIPIELALSESNLNGQVIYIGIIRDITERKIAQKKLHDLAYFDTVSALPNLHSFKVDFESLLNKAKMVKNDIYVAVLDIDRLSEINLIYGLKVGDWIIRELTRLVQKNMTNGYKLYRGQGGSFILISESPVNSLSKKMAKSISEQESAIQDKINTEINIEGYSHNLRVSISSVLISASKTSYENTLSLVEFMRKELKKSAGGDLIRLQKEDCDKFERHNIIKSSLSEMFNSEQLYPVIQPKFNANGQIVSSELLIRWQHPLLGNVSPDEFIAIAEQSDRINDISLWVLNQACRLLHVCCQKGITTAIAVNLSVKDFIRPDFEKVVLDVAKIHNVSPNSLIFEITETSLISDFNLVKRKLEHLSKNGFSFSIDDFGTGYSSLAYLSSLPVHELKIDRQFISEIGESITQTFPVIDNIIRLAKDLGLVTVAEGIETIEQLNYLKSKKCDLFQGYLLSKPLSENDWLTFLENSPQS